MIESWLDLHSAFNLNHKNHDWIFTQPQSLLVGAQESRESIENPGFFHHLSVFFVTHIWFRQAYSAKQLDKLESEFKVNFQNFTVKMIFLIQYSHTKKEKYYNITW